MSSHAPDDVHADLLAGKPVRFPKPDPAETAEQAAARTLPAAWIEGLIAEPDRVCNVPIVVENAIIDGEIVKSFAEFKYSVDFHACDFLGELRLPGAVFRRKCAFSDCRFHRNLRLLGVSVPFSLDLRGAIVEGDLWLNDTTIGTLLEGSGGEFHVVHVERVKARGMHFRTRRVDGRLQPTIFHGDTRFHDCAIEGNVDLDGVQFRAQVNFSRLHAGANLYVRTAIHDDDLVHIDRDFPPAVFEGEALFREMSVSGSVMFAGVQFKAPVTFELSTIGADLLFLEFKDVSDVRPNVFGADVDMKRVSVAGRTLFAASQFKGKVDLRFAQLAGACFFTAGSGNAHPPLFDREVILSLARIGGNLELTGGTFRGKVDFMALQVAGDFMIYEASDGRAVHFEEDVDCNGMAIDGSVQWTCPNFEKNVFFADLSCGRTFSFWPSLDPAGPKPRIGGNARFNAARIGREVNLMDTKFEGSANFYGLSSHNVLLARTQISQRLSFVDANVSTLRLAEAAPDGSLQEFAELPEIVDLRGARFERLSADVMELARRQEPYDRGVFETLETHLRKTGNDREAGRIYYFRKRRESKALRHRVFARDSGRRLRERLSELPSVVADFVAWSVYRYGVRPLRLLIASLLIVIAGTVVFSQSGAVEKKEKGSPAEAKPADLTPMRALGYSLRLFIPVVELPMADDLRPTKQSLSGDGRSSLTVEGYAMIHRLAGAALVPLGVAALAGILVRKPRS
jgi:uncharacterized protein YjbI with pentapeptide repeats